LDGPLKEANGLYNDTSKEQSWLYHSQ
jgi:hypothetical protein